MRYPRHDSPTHPVLIVNPKSGNGRAADIDLIPTARGLGLETVTMHDGDDLGSLAELAVDRGCDHLIMVGGDGSLAIVAGVALARDVPFSCIPVGTRNHFAMDLGLDRRDPVRSLDAVLNGVEKLVDVGMVAGQVFLNTVSIGPYPRAIADPDYRNHRARSMADAAIGTVRDPRAHITVTLIDGRVVSDVEVLLVSNNPYRVIGPPDFATRPALDTGMLGIILTDRRTRMTRGPALFTRWETRALTIRADPAEIEIGIDGELRRLRSPIEVTIAPKALRVLVPRRSRPSSPRESTDPLSERAIIRLGGVPAAPRPGNADAISGLLHRLHEVDEWVFALIAGGRSPALDRLLPGLSTAASHSKIWIAAAAAMALAGGARGRRTAMVGIAALVTTSAVTNLVGKTLFGRRRPTGTVPGARMLPMPDSSSMPSGHTASAAAFARVVGAAYPWLRIPLTILAAAVGFSRVYTGVHYPSDAAAGWLLGAGIGSLLQRGFLSAQPSQIAGGPAPAVQSTGRTTGNDQVPSSTSRLGR